MHLLTIDELRPALYQTWRTADLIELKVKTCSTPYIHEITVNDLGRDAPLSRLLDRATNPNDTRIYFEHGEYHVEVMTDDADYRYYEIQTHMSRRKRRQFIAYLSEPTTKEHNLDMMLKDHCRDAYWLIRDVLNASYMAPWEPEHEGWICHTPICTCTLKQNDENLYEVSILERHNEETSYVIWSEEPVPEIQRRAVEILLKHYDTQRNAINDVTKAIRETLD